MTDRYDTAAAAAIVLIGEVVNTQEIVGGSLIILACLVNEMNFGLSSTAKIPPPPPPAIENSAGSQTKLL